MSRYIEAFTSYNKNNKGKKIWCFATTQSNLAMDIIQRILFEQVYEYGCEIITPKQIKNNLEHYKNFLCILELEQKEIIINSINALIIRIEKQNMKYVLFKIG